MRRRSFTIDYSSRMSFLVRHTMEYGDSKHHTFLYKEIEESPTAKHTLKAGKKRQHKILSPLGKIIMAVRVASLFVNLCAPTVWSNLKYCTICFAREIVQRISFDDGSVGMYRTYLCSRGDDQGIFLTKEQGSASRYIYKHHRETRLTTLSNINAHNNTIASTIATAPIPILNQRE
mmetsp:Transcript_27000/g.49027  ORF Transcript_27000/g.49027 Transcript_27000/m.49027 type:complete len:176 (+) Transcript_27000:1342-1869(+)